MTLGSHHAEVVDRLDLDPDIPILKVNNLTVYQGRYLAVDRVSFEVWAGTDAAIVGPNGAGKSTLVEAILGLIPAMGEIQVFGRPLNRLGNLRQLIGYIPQNFVFDRTFPISVRELVSLGWIQRRSYPWQRDPTKSAAIAHALEQVGVTHLQHQPIGTLSGGEMKRVLLAYCLVSPRRLLVLDEAFAGVDQQGETEFYTLLYQLRQQQQWTILQISHDLDMVSRYCDRVLCLNHTLVCQGQPETALSPENLLSAYGPGFSRYQHHHH